MICGVHLLSMRNGSKKPGDVGKAFLLSLLSENQIAHVGLTLASEGIFQVVFGHFSHFLTSSYCCHEILHAYRFA
jgi:hypothetical protein